MQKRKFEHYVKQVTALTMRQRQHLLGLLLPAIKRDRAVEMYVLESHKGSRTLDRPPRKRGGKATKRGISKEQICILVARDRSGQTLDWMPGKGPVTPQQLREHVKTRLAPDVLLVTDGHPAYRHFALEAGITHEAVNLNGRINLPAPVPLKAPVPNSSRFFAKKFWSSPSLPGLVHPKASGARPLSAP